MSWEQVIGGTGTAVVALAIGVMTYRRSRAVDAVSEQSGAVTEARAGTSQIIDGLNGLVDALQDDNKNFREDIRLLTARLDACFADREQLRLEVARLRRKYGDNADTPPSGTRST